MSVLYLAFEKIIATKKVPNISGTRAYDAIEEFNVD